MACPNEYQEYLIARRFSSSQVFFTADTHFGYANIIKYCHRPFATVEEMDDALVRNWNAVVSPDATVFHLGDFALDSKEKYLIIGNHDKGRISDVWQFYGHIHSGPLNYDNKALPLLQTLSPTQYDVGVDNNGFRPVSFELITQTSRSKK